MSSAAIRYALSNEDIYAMLKGKTNIIAYRELADVDRIEDVMSHDSCVILYETRDRSGHWCCMFFRYPKGRRRTPDLQWFDSYGMMPDSELKYIDNNYRKKSNQKRTHLTSLIIDWIDRTGGKFKYSQYKLQRLSPTDNTCGRFVVLRLRMPDLDENQFAKLVYNSERAVDLTS